MKTLEISKASKSLAAYANQLGKETIVVTSNKRPVAALVSLEHIDREALSLSDHPDFLRLIEVSRKQIRKGKTLSLAQLKKRFVGGGA
jgi:PHD/YefM family antitoxin component YafN of YafNO toxin-antitoxin module